MLNKKITTSILIISLIFISGCSIYHIDSNDVSSEYYDQKDSPEDVVYIEDIEKPHEIIGYVTVNAERSQKIEKIIDKMKQEAAILGGDAITDIETDATGLWKRLPAQKLIGNAYIRANYRASVAVFK